AVPGAEGWQLMVGHGETGKVEIGGQLLGTTEALSHAPGADKLAFITCYAANPSDGGLSLAPDAPMQSARPTLGPTHEATVTIDGDVISGVMGVDKKTGRQVVVPKGDWIAYESGKPRPLGTASLKEAWTDKLGATIREGGPAPEAAVGFVYG